MSDLSMMEQSFALLPATMVPPLAEDVTLYQEEPISTNVQPHEVSFRQLRGAREIARIVHLRDEIALSCAARADASFGTREKKETKSVSSAPSFATANT